MTHLLKKVQAELKKLPPFKKVVVGVSGGIDSVSLGHILIALGYSVTFAHLNHQLREKASDADEEFVKQLAKKWKVPFFSKKVRVPKKGNLEQNARQLRYAFLEDIRKKQKAELIAVAHHFDDQIETILMHSERGTGLRGLRGMPVLSGFILRPFIHMTKKEIEKYGADHHLSYMNDESNADIRFKRNLLRHKLIPKIKKSNKDLDKFIKELSDQAEKNLRSLTKKREKWFQKNYTDSSFSRISFNGLSDDLKGEILIHFLGAKDLYKKSIDRLIDFIKNGKTGKRVTVKDKTFIIDYKRILMQSVNDEPSSFTKKKITQKGIMWGSWKIRTSKPITLYARPWKKGDRFQPSGMKGSKKLQDFFVDQKIPLHLRHQIPVIVDKKGDIICVANFRFSEDGKKFKQLINIECAERSA